MTQAATLVLSVHEQSNDSVMQLESTGGWFLRLPPFVLGFALERSGTLAMPLDLVFLLFAQTAGGLEPAALLSTGIHLRAGQHFSSTVLLATVCLPRLLLLFRGGLPRDLTGCNFSCFGGRHALVA